MTCVQNCSPLGHVFEIRVLGYPPTLITTGALQPIQLSPYTSMSFCPPAALSSAAPVYFCHLIIPTPNEAWPFMPRSPFVHSWQKQTPLCSAAGPGSGGAPKHAVDLRLLFPCYLLASASCGTQPSPAAPGKRSYFCQMACPTLCQGASWHEGLGQACLASSENRMAKVIWGRGGKCVTGISNEDSGNYFFHCNFKSSLCFITSVPCCLSVCCFHGKDIVEFLFCRAVQAL